MRRNKKLTLPKLAVFDMDGLLFDTETLFKRNKAVVMKKYGYELTDADYEKTLGICGQRLTEVLDELYGPEYPAADISRETRALVTEEIMENGPPVMEGIPELLEWLKGKKIPCCVASSTQTPIVRSYLERGGLMKYFSSVIGGDQVSASKPDPEIFLASCARLNVRPEDALVFEDSQNGVLAALNGGIPVVCIPDLTVPEEAVLEKAAAVVRSAREVPALFEN